MSTKSGISIQSVSNAEGQDAVRKTVGAGLSQFNLQFAPPTTFEPLVVSATSADGRIVGGLVGEVRPGWHWLHVAWLWVEETHRIQGVGRRLLLAAELEASRRGCRHVGLDTFSFQARGFYEKQGYVVFGVQEDYPPGHTRFHLRKDL